MNKDGLKSIKVAIFDFDGTILDSEPIWCELSSALVSELCGGHISFDEWIQNYQHKPSVSALVVKDFKLNKSAEEFREIRNERFKDLCQKNPEKIRGRAVQEVLDSIDHFTCQNIPMYVVSCSFAGPIKEALRTLGILDRFAEIRDDVQDKASEYSKIARKENVEADNCMVFEDSEDNIAIAEELGMKAFLVTTQTSTKLDRDGDFS